MERVIEPPSEEFRISTFIDPDKFRYVDTIEDKALWEKYVFKYGKFHYIVEDSAEHYTLFIVQDGNLYGVSREVMADIQSLCKIWLANKWDMPVYKFLSESFHGAT